MPPKAASKKRRRAESSVVDAGPPGRDPIIFVSPGLQPDVRLRVFHQPFHVHSIVLKLHSNYFRKFLDSPDKSDGPASASFQYEYTTVVDEDGDWGLEAADKAAPHSPYSLEEAFQAQIQVPDQIRAFKNILSAMYNRPYTIDDSYEMLAMTKLADFYCALPIVSATLTGALLGSPMFTLKEMAKHPYTDMEMMAPSLLDAACKLRHKVLFRESFVHVVSQLSKIRRERNLNRRPPLLLGPTLKPLIKNAYIKLLERIMTANQVLNNRIVTCPFRLGPMHETSTEPTENAEWFYAIRNQLSYVSDPDLKYHMDAVLKNNLVLDQTGFGPGESLYAKRFLCAQIADKDMPWDPAETDW
ncbi:hypothetical protein LARI1_G000514 [Lachnellula arida]|uniref:BTB domain-containing protein n=1 Tax=Lachnellula arida TaxID=1316785 RepID=A0A8T9BUE7_9HELO|nr:hypothetical protein LARI1_G000514 [Lachnellula arida]